MAVKDHGRRFYERGMRITRFCRVCYNTRDYAGNSSRKIKGLLLSDLLPSRELSLF